MDKLPTEILLLISSFLDRRERIALRLVNGSFRHALGREVWTKLRFHGDHTLSKLAGWTSIRHIPDFNRSLSRSPEESRLVREVMVEKDCTDFMVQLEKFTYLQDLYLMVAKDSRLPLSDILAKTTQARRHVTYSAHYSGHLFAGHDVTTLALNIGHHPLTGCVSGLWGTPYLPESLEDFSVTGDLVHYAEVLIKTWSMCRNLQTLSINVPLYNSFGIDWVPDTVTQLTISDCGEIPFEKYSRPARLRNVKTLIANDPSRSLRMIELDPDCHLESLTLRSTDRIRELDDVDGQFYSQTEREIAQLAARFLPVHTLRCIHLSLSLTAVLCSSVKRLIIEDPKTPAQTTFTNFNGMLTRLAHHQLQLLVPKCSQLEYIYIDHFLDFMDETRGMEFLKDLIKQSRHISTVMLVINDATFGLVPYHECLHAVQDSQLPRQPDVVTSEWLLDISQFRRTYL